MRRNKNRLLSVLLTIVITLTLFAAAPMTVYAASVSGDYTIFLNSTTGDLELGSGSTDTTNILGNAGATVTGIPGAWVLTLNNFSFTTTADHALSVPGGTTIVLVGDNSLTSSNSNTPISSLSDGIVAFGNLTITGPGRLTTTSGEADFSYGIQTTGGFSINGGAIVNATGNIATMLSIGIYAVGGLTISGGSTVTSTGGSAGFFSAGIFKINSLSISENSTVIANGGTTTASPSFNTGSYGIYLWSGSTSAMFAFSGSTIQAEGNTMAIAIFDQPEDPQYPYNPTPAPTLSYFTVPAGYTYWVNEQMSDPGGSGTISDGSFLISGIYRFARIMFVPPPPSPNVPQTSDVSNAVGWTALLALVILSVFGLVAWRRKQGARE